MAISPYIAELREIIGTRLLLMPCACVIPTDEQGRILLVRQLQHGKWETIGGSIEPDESPHEAAVREAREEASIDVELTLIAALGGSEYNVVYPNGDRCQCVSTVYEARIVGGEPAPDHDETDEVRWFSRHELETDPDIGEFCRTTLRAVGFLGAPSDA
jgi:8-oxo-dGTP pyrophosphatase MutT (NUDIX family)